MARYGSDFTSGRYTRVERGESGMGYDVGYRGGSRMHGYSPGRIRGWSSLEASPGWGGPNREFARDLDESWGSMGHGGGRQDFGDQGYGRGSGFGFRGTSRNLYDREIHRAGGRMGHDYDDDFGDRIRRGWNRFRNEARGWMGGGYDRGW